jgi:hypothetical protein
LKDRFEVANKASHELFHHEVTFKSAFGVGDMQVSGISLHHPLRQRDTPTVGITPMQALTVNVSDCALPQTK